MRNVVIVAEGPTEQAFIERVLQPHLGDDVWLTSLVVHTSETADGRTHRGGGGWRHYESHLRRFAAQPHWDLITTMIDLYGFPADGPACDCAPMHAPVPCARSRANRISDAIGNPRVRPFIMVHEFEAIVIAAAAESPDVFGNVAQADRLRQLLTAADGDAEHINGGQSTAPSKRLEGLIPEYQKIRDGIALVEQVGLDRVLPHAPHLASWLTQLTGR